MSTHLVPGRVSVVVVNFRGAEDTIACLEAGVQYIELPIAYDGQTIAITLDPRFVNDFLKVLEPEKSFTIDLQDSDAAAVCTTDDGYGYVIMPLARDR